MNNNIISPADAYFLTINSIATKDSSFYRLRNFCMFTFNTPDFDLCKWGDLTYIKVLDFMCHQQKKELSFSSINVGLSLLKGVALHAWQLEVISIESYMRIKAIKKLKTSKLSSGRALSLEEIEILKQKHERATSVIEIRDFAVFALAVGTGLRRHELSKLDIEQFNSDKLIITGKGNKDRVVYLTPFVIKSVKRWLSVRNASKGALFARIFRDDTFGKRLQIQGIHGSIRKTQLNSGVAHFTTHDLRRTFATTLLDVGADKFAVQRLMGHELLSTTERYDKRGDRAAKAAIDLLPF